MIEIIMGLLVVIFGFFLKAKSDANTINDLEEKDAMHEKENEIIEDMQLAEVKIKEKKDEAIKDINTDNWRDNI